MSHGWASIEHMFDLDGIAREDRSGWSAAARSERLLELLELREQVEAEVLRCLGEWDADLAWTADGSRSPSCWLARRTPVALHDARDLVRTARLVQSNTTTSKALAAGDISSAHVKTAARAARHVEDLYADHEAALVDAARALSPDDFRTVAAHWRSCADDAIGRAPSARSFDRRHVHLSEVLDGMGRVDGYLDAETLRRFADVLDALEPPDPVDGGISPRPLAVRRADAVAKLVSGQRAPSVTVNAVVDLDTLQGRFPADLTDVRCELVGGGPVDVATMMRMACDGSISRVLMQGTSVVLDLGRATPVVSDAQRRALAIRDGGCVEPGCDAPPAWCDAHHRWHWVDGGPTDLDNLELRCRRHHVEVHHRRGPPERLPA